VREISVTIAQAFDHHVGSRKTLLFDAEKGGSRWQELGQPTALIGR
jgi:hypothetical protein